MKKKEEPVVAYGWIKYTVKQQADGRFRCALTDHEAITSTTLDVMDAVSNCFRDFALEVRCGKIKP